MGRGRRVVVVVDLPAVLRLRTLLLLRLVVGLDGVVVVDT